VGHWSDNDATLTATDPQHFETGVSGFTPIELLMSITLLGIVAATLVPQMLSANEETRQNALLQRLHLVRGQIEQFRATHDGRLPGAGQNSARVFLLDLDRGASDSTDASSNRKMRNHQTQIQPGYEIPPLNLYTQRSGILVIPDRLQVRHYSGKGRHGWAYSSTTGEFRANLSPQTKDRSGRLLNQL
jgi:type II secretory pathway pseudopilin PulG